MQTEDSQITTDEPLEPSTLLAKAQERRQKRESHLFIDVPTWDGDLIAEYRILAPEEITEMGNKMATRSRNGMEPGDNDISIIIAMHVGLHVLDRESGKRVAITDKFGHVGYDRIAVWLGKDEELKSQADTIKYLTGERDPDDPNKWTTNLIAISMHSNAIQRWMRDTSKRTVGLEALLGEL